MRFKSAAKKLPAGLPILLSATAHYRRDTKRVTDANPVERNGLIVINNLIEDNTTDAIMIYTYATFGIRCLIQILAVLAVPALVIYLLMRKR